MSRQYTPNVQPSSIVALVKSNQRRRLQKYPEDIYGKVGTKERRAKTQKCSQLRCTYGITYPEYMMLSEDQDHVCAICKNPELGIHNRGHQTVPLSLSVDHCHDTGSIRGLLCAKCNKALGLYNDNIELLEAAIEYLRKHSGG